MQRAYSVLKQKVYLLCREPSLQQAHEILCFYAHHRRHGSGTQIEVQVLDDFGLRPRRVAESHA